MHKIRATKREMKENYYVLCVSYCGAQTLLKYQNAVAYSTRAEGWACDYYEVDNVVISTGYAPIKSKNVICDYELIKKYEDRARKLESNYGLSYKQRKSRVNNLLKRFIEEIKG
jgi:hypothetical protein